MTLFRLIAPMHVLQWLASLGVMSEEWMADRLRKDGRIE